MGSVILAELERFGPRQCEQLDSAAALVYVRQLATSHYENFSVLNRLVPVDLRDDFAAVYAFCRWADDLGDEIGDREQSLQLLAWWRDELQRCYRGEPRHPVFIALEPTIRRHDIPAEPFEDLISAFEQDQRLTRYPDWPALLDYCRRSANPVGRLVLYLAGYRDATRQQLSDATCTALQLANFWQDVRRDIFERDRIYLPADVLADHGLDHATVEQLVRGRIEPTESVVQAYRTALADVVGRTWPLFRRGHRLWPLVDRRVRTSIRLFTMGGQTVLRRIERVNYDTWQQRPRVGNLTKGWLIGRALFAAAVGRLQPRRAAGEALT
jgi:squalene synthase HpnC